MSTLCITQCDPPFECEWRMRACNTKVNWYQLALIYFNNKIQWEQQRRKLSSICVAYLDLKKNVIDKGYMITLERFACINIISLLIYMFPHGVL